MQMETFLDEYDPTTAAYREQPGSLLYVVY